MTQQQEWTKLKAGLTKIKKTGDTAKIIAFCDEAMARFAVIGWPDYWSDFDRAKDDAMMAVAYGTPFAG